MRKRHWLASLLGGALWAALPSMGWAQAGPQSADYGSGPAQGGAYVPYIDPGSAQAAGYQPAYTGMESAGWPQGANQWPNISPYTAPYGDQTSYQNGFWFNQQFRGGRKYYSYLAATLNRFADPDDVTVGDKNAPGLYGAQHDYGFQNVTTVGARDFYPAHKWSDVTDVLSGGGFMGMAGWENPDHSGAFINGFWAEEGTGTYDPFHGHPGDPDRPNDTFRTGNGLGVFDGGDPTEIPLQNPTQIDPITIPGGGTQAYDMFYKLAWQSQAYGAGLGFYGNPLMNGDTFRLRPMAGLRYVNVRENATFEGVDSGVYPYTIDPITQRPTGTITVVDDEILHAYLRSNTKSQLAGPEVGLRLDFGGDNLEIWLQSKFGLLANHSTREIDGYGIGRVSDPTNTNNTAQVTAANLNDRTLSGFHQQETTTNVTPTFEQSIFAKAPILGYVPGVRKLRVFQEAQFQIGYTWFVMGGMYRPGNVIDWAGFPSFPKLNSEKTTYFISSVSLGVEWEY